MLPAPGAWQNDNTEQREAALLCFKYVEGSKCLIYLCAFHSAQCRILTITCLKITYYYCLYEFLLYYYALYYDLDVFPI